MPEWNQPMPEKYLVPSEATRAYAQPSNSRLVPGQVGALA
ncbi:unnamed protein product [Rhodiola kirilowii]